MLEPICGFARLTPPSQLRPPARPPEYWGQTREPLPSSPPATEKSFWRMAHFWRLGGCLPVDSLNPFFNGPVHGLVPPPHDLRHGGGAAPHPPAELHGLFGQVVRCVTGVWVQRALKSQRSEPARASPHETRAHLEEGLLGPRMWLTVSCSRKMAQWWVGRHPGCVGPMVRGARGGMTPDGPWPAHHGLKQGPSPVRPAPWALSMSGAALGQRDGHSSTLSVVGVGGGAQGRACSHKLHHPLCR